jgi:two-component system response regulator GlrR
MPLGKILVVDDDPHLQELIRMRLESGDYEVATAFNREEALNAVKGQAVDLSIVDLQLVHQSGTQWDGIALMEQLHQISPYLPVIILTAHGSIESAVEAMKRGAYSYLTKPFNPQDMLLQIEKALEKYRLTSEIERLRGLLEEKYSFDNIVAKSGKMQKILEVVSQIATTESTIFLHGESGTGKELIAKAIHLASNRKNNPFVAINCAAIPEPLLESKLFGHEKGAFTGAIRATKGLFTQAHEGTIFLDEIGDMSLPIQAKVLRVLQERQFYPVGSEKIVETDVRVVVATNKNLEEQVRQGLFREDLFYRIHVIPIYLPPLRERREDIPTLVQYFINKFNEKMKKKIKGVTPRAMQRLMLFDWPGNVRELENTIEYGSAMTNQEFISEEFILQTKTEKTETMQDTFKPLKEARDAFEKNYLKHVLQICEGNISKASELAGKYRADFYDLLRKHGLKAADYKKSDTA